MFSVNLVNDDGFNLKRRFTRKRRMFNEVENVPPCVQEDYASWFSLPSCVQSGVFGGRK